MSFVELEESGVSVSVISEKVYIKGKKNENCDLQYSRYNTTRLASSSLASFRGWVVKSFCFLG